MTSDPQAPSTEPEKFEDNPAHWDAARSNDVAALRKLAARPGVVDRQGICRRFCPLTAAIRETEHRSLKTIEALLVHFQADGQNHNAQTPLATLLDNPRSGEKGLADDVAIVRSLLSAGASPWGVGRGGGNQRKVFPTWWVAVRRTAPEILDAFEANGWIPASWSTPPALRESSCFILVNPLMAVCESWFETCWQPSSFEARPPDGQKAVRSPRATLDWLLARGLSLDDSAGMGGGSVLEVWRQQAPLAAANEQARLLEKVTAVAGPCRALPRL